ncbi:MAG: histidine kinase [Acidobacteria bacterium]|nr:histidine kinase [Acidobacteriota bacterium]
MWTQRRIQIGFVLVILVVLVNALVAYDSIKRLQQKTEAVSHTHEVLLGTAQLLEALLNAETGQRGYVITNVKEYLDPYYAGVRMVQPRLDLLGTYFDDDAESREHYRQLKPLIKQKLEELEATIALSDRTNLMDTRTAIVSRRGKTLMDQVRGVIGRIEQRQTDIRKQRLIERDAAIQSALLALVIGMSITLAAIALAYTLNRREVEANVRGQAALEEANARLEARVEERTIQLNTTNQELARSNRELQDFAFVASHDLQEPLRKIQAFGDLLKKDYGTALGAEGCDFIERMQNASRRMDRLIKDLLAFSRVTTKAQPFVPTDLNKIGQEVMEDLEARIRRSGGKVEFADLPTLEADALQVHQLLLNLIGNALKFHRAGVPPVITVNATEEADMIELSVADNGIGFDEKYLDRIFTPFQRLHGKNEFEGTGMGLAICRKVVERHGGTITARSQPNVGSTFVIRLPRTHQPPTVQTIEENS